jgi:uncharacterized protein DUF6931
MSRGLASKFQQKPAKDLCAPIKLSDAATGLLTEIKTPQAFLADLLDNKLFEDAVKFLAQALPKQDAIRWAALVARAAAGPSPPPNIAAALDAADAWLKDPSDENRRAAYKASEVATLGKPAGCAALAVFFSGGSLAPPAAPVVPPAEHLSGHAVSGAVMLAAVADPPKAKERYQKFINDGLRLVGIGA